MSCRKPLEIFSQARTTCFAPGFPSRFPHRILPRFHTRRVPNQETLRKLLKHLKINPCKEKSEWGSKPAVCPKMELAELIKKQ